MLFTSYTGRNRVNNRNAGVSAVRQDRPVRCLDSHFVLFSIVESLLRALCPFWFGSVSQPDETR